MLQEENEAYEPYTPSYQQGPFEPVAVLENPTDTHAPAEQDTSPLPLIPQGPKHPLPPQNRQGRGGAILLFTLVLAIIFAVGLFAGLEYAGSTGSAVAKVVQPLLRRQQLQLQLLHPVLRRLKLNRRPRLQK